jgi:hypothetical protein
MARQRPRQRNKQAKKIKQDKKTRQEKFFFSKKVHTQKAVDFAQKAAKLPLFRQLTDLFSTCLHTATFYTSGHFDTCVKMKIK